MYLQSSSCFLLLLSRADKVAKRKQAIFFLKWLIHLLSSLCIFIGDASFISMQQDTAAAAEKADFHVRYRLPSSSPASAENTSDYLIETFSTTSAHFSVWACEEKYPHPTSSPTPPPTALHTLSLSIPNVSSHLCLCQHSARTSGGQCHSVVLTRASERPKCG